MRSSSSAANASARISFLVLVVWAVLPPLGSATASLQNVALVKSSTLPPFEEATRSIVATLREQPVQPEILMFDLEGKAENGPRVFERVRNAKPVLVISVGSLATSAALESSLAVPIVFSMVLYPRESGFLDRSAEATGVALDVPLELQFSTLRRLFPSARKVGVLYNEAETGSLVQRARPVAAEHGLELVGVRIEEPGAVAAEFAELASRIDALWTVADSHVFTPQTTSALLLASLRRRVPVIGLSPAQVRAGAVVAVYCDYGDIGRQTGEIAARVLRGETPAGIPIASPRLLRIALNRRTADHLSIAVPAELEREAAEVVR